MRNANCPLCGDSFKDGPGYLVEGARKYPKQRRWWPGRFLICAGCYGFGHDPETGALRPEHMRELDGARWYRVVGRGEQMPPVPCAACGRPFIRNADPLLKRPTCSPTCSTDLTRIRNGNQGSGQPCEACGEQITTGRADSRYCGAACRQKAYRRRSSTGSRNDG
ncbi:hypothetical protein ACWCQW_35400 [Streptomyces mirabilis]